MGKSHIEFNGKVYDLKSDQGTPNHHHARVAAKPSPAPIAPKTSPKPITITDGRAVDGVVRPKAHASHTPATPAHKRLQRSKTLMRSAVHKPVVNQATKSHPITKPVVINTERLSRANQIRRSKLINRFGPKHATSIAPQIAPLSVQPEPDVLTPDPVLNDHFEKAVVKVPKGHAISHANPFENALANATSHTQPKPKRPSRTHRTAHKLHTSAKVVRATAVIILLLGVGGFFVQKNIPELAMKIASSKAGIKAQLPDYQPSGFSLNGAIRYSPGQVELSYKSNSDDRSFKITQNSTQLTHTSLQPTQVLGTNTSYQTIQSGDKTIYIDDQNRATWVESGILYEVDGSGLSNDQLLRLAASL